MFDKKLYMKDYRKIHRKKLLEQHREYHLIHKEYENEYKKEYRKTHPDKPNKVKINARNFAFNHIPLNSSCGVCGATKNLERHHPNYNHQEQVLTLCRRCHTIVG